MANCLHPTTCTVCGFQPDQELGEHACDAWEEEKEATCAEEGYQKGICKFCGKEFTLTLEKPDHTFGNWETASEPTCQAEGERVRTCSVCGQEERETLAKLDHDLGDWEEAQLPVYGTDGSYTKTCRSCGEVIETRPYPFSDLIKDRYSLKGDTEGFTVTDVNVYAKTVYGYIEVGVLAEITNTGDKNISLEGCSFDLNDDDGNLLTSISSDDGVTAPSILKPGEVGYFTAWSGYDETADELDLSRGIHPYANIRIKSTGKEPVRYDVSDVSWKGQSPSCVGRITNNTGKDEDEVQVAAFFLDDSGRVINTAWNLWLDEPLPAGDTISFDLDAAWYNQENGGQVRDVRVFAYPYEY